TRTASQPSFAARVVWWSITLEGTRMAEQQRGNSAGRPSPLTAFIVSVLILASGWALAGCVRHTEGALRPREAALMLATLEQAPTHGFRPNAFGEGGLNPLLRDPETRRAAERRLLRAMVAYARAQH